MYFVLYGHTIPRPEVYVNRKIEKVEKFFALNVTLFIY